MADILDRFKTPSLRYAIATNILEGHKFTEEELLDFERLDRGEITTEEMRNKLIEELGGNKHGNKLTRSTGNRNRRKVSLQPSRQKRRFVHSSPFKSYEPYGHGR